jgi:hypothetical protein
MHFIQLKVSIFDTLRGWLVVLAFAFSRFIRVEISSNLVETKVRLLQQVYEVRAHCYPTQSTLLTTYNVNWAQSH